LAAHPLQTSIRRPKFDSADGPVERLGTVGCQLIEGRDVR
jgi:hypothetical protein